MITYLPHRRKAFQGGVAPTPDLMHWPLADASGTTIAADVGVGSTTSTGTLNSDFLAMASANAPFGATSDTTWGTNVVSASFWYRTDSYSYGGSIFRSRYVTNSDFFEFNTNSGTLSVRVYGTTGSLLGDIFQPHSINTWTHFAAVFDNSTATGAVKLFMDGVSQTLTPSTSDKTGTSNFATDTFYIKSIFSDANQFDIDDLQIFSGEVSQTEIEAIVAAGRP